MKIHKALVCLFKGHDVNPEESIVSDIMLDKRNWLCECHRCGLYVMHDGAIANDSITIPKCMALDIKSDFEKEFGIKEDE